MICVRSVDLKPPKTLWVLLHLTSNQYVMQCMDDVDEIVPALWYSGGGMMPHFCSLEPFTQSPILSPPLLHKTCLLLSFRAYTFRLTNFLQSFSTSYSLKTQAYGNPPDDCFTGHLTCSEIPWVEWAIYCVCTPLIILQNMHFLHYGKKLCAWEDKWSRRML